MKSSIDVGVGIQPAVDIHQVHAGPEVFRCFDLRCFDLGFVIGDFVQGSGCVRCSCPGGLGGGSLLGRRFSVIAAECDPNQDRNCNDEDHRGGDPASHVQTLRVCVGDLWRLTRCSPLRKNLHDAESTSMSPHGLVGAELAFTTGQVEGMAHLLSSLAGVARR